MKIELFYSPGCERCARAKADLRAIAEATVNDVEWREIDVLDALDRAVEVGVLTLPALAIDGTLAFAALPTPTQLRQELLRRVKHG
ncbi:glutaredoxin family protein [Pseudomonas sp. TCU-HL1]|uniref:glutaredoxin family protein n=1 Tax=Pseudomonas sp. TCU-HL1 TaxID=1856685 RepID=UPI00083DA63F|nr:thioredoxin family protein [Pseudomonas sp. TCU-HL1]AOE85932.1 thioredoxin [Pseudomonas sp. TCU-HL1]